ncbi:MAG: hypothetical protein QOE01_3167 [Actinomycetota bacterium]|jgi:hypothetical protein|nr:hypothetical protein [Actinomycetota bacterium]
MSALLTRIALEIERHVAEAGWDQHPKLYALVETADLARREPQLATALAVDPSTPGGLTPVDQGELPAYSSLDGLLAGITWPPEVLGSAIAVERLMVPPEVEREMPPDESSALRWLADHPRREEVRLVVAVLRDGTRSAVLRMRSHDDEQSVLSGPDLVPGLADALASTLRD